jgi:hypothetical protein
MHSLWLRNLLITLTGGPRQSRDAVSPLAAMRHPQSILVSGRWSAEGRSKVPSGTAQILVNTAAYRSVVSLLQQWILVLFCITFAAVCTLEFLVVAVG